MPTTKNYALAGDPWADNWSEWHRIACDALGLSVPEAAGRNIIAYHGRKLELTPRGKKLVEGLQERARRREVGWRPILRVDFTLGIFMALVCQKEHQLQDYFEERCGRRPYRVGIRLGKAWAWLVFEDKSERMMYMMKADHDKWLAS